jgi:hypothetical protein
MTCGPNLTVAPATCGSGTAVVWFSRRISGKYALFGDLLTPSKQALGACRQPPIAESANDRRFRFRFFGFMFLVS